MIPTPPPSDMRHMVCFSGGHSSARVAVEVVRKFGKDRVILLNHDIVERSEVTDIKRFKREVAAYLGLPITYANMVGWDEKDQFDVVVHEQAFKAGAGTAICTSRMKTRPFESYLAREFPRKNALVYYGFDKTEGLRIQRRMVHLAGLGYGTRFPLAHWPVTIQSTEEIGIAPPSTYSVFKHANCVGCLKAGRQHWYVVYCTRPDVWARAKWAEAEIGYTIIKGVSLEDLEPMFERMKCAGVEPTEHVPAQKFWAFVRALGITMDDEGDQKPCECVT